MTNPYYSRDRRSKAFFYRNESFSRGSGRTEHESAVSYDAHAFGPRWRPTALDDDENGRDSSPSLSPWGIEAMVSESADTTEPSGCERGLSTKYRPSRLAMPVQAELRAAKNPQHEPLLRPRPPSPPVYWLLAPGC
jgi:hypothetical protein